MMLLILEGSLNQLSTQFFEVNNLLGSLTEGYDLKM